MDKFNEKTTYTYNFRTSKFQTTNELTISTYFLWRSSNAIQEIIKKYDDKRYVLFIVYYWINGTTDAQFGGSGTNKNKDSVDKVIDIIGSRKFGIKHIDTRCLIKHYHKSSSTLHSLDLCKLNKTFQSKKRPQKLSFYKAGLIVHTNNFADIKKFIGVCKRTMDTDIKEFAIVPIGQAMRIAKKLQPKAGEFKWDFNKGEMIGEVTHRSMDLIRKLSMERKKLSKKSFSVPKIDTNVNKFDKKTLSAPNKTPVFDFKKVDTPREDILNSPIDKSPIVKAVVKEPKGKEVKIIKPIAVRATPYEQTLLVDELVYLINYIETMMFVQSVKPGKQKFDFKGYMDEARLLVKGLLNYYKKEQLMSALKRELTTDALQYAKLQLIF